MQIHDRRKVELNAVLVCDSISQSKIKTSLTELDRLGLRIIYTLDDISSVLNEDGSQTKVILLNDITSQPRILNRLILCKKAYNLSYIYLSDNDYSLEYMSNYAECFKLDITVLDYTTVHSVLFKDLATIEKLKVKDSRPSDVIEFANQVIESSDVDQEARDLALDYLTQIEVNKNLNKIIEKLKMRTSRAEESELRQKKLTNMLQDSYISLIENSRKVNESLKQYEVILSEDIYTKVPVGKYDNRPVIIYFKVYKELIHLNSFIDTLYKMIRIQLKSSVKVLRLYDSHSSKIAPVFPSEYKVIKDSFYSSDIDNNDFIIKYGNYQKVLNKLFTNSIGLKFLIILDMKDHNDIVTIGSDLEYSICRNVNDITGLNLNKYNTIVNNDTDNGTVLSWDTYPTYGTFESEDEQFAFLSSRPVIRRIFNDIKRVANV